MKGEIVSLKTAKAIMKLQEENKELQQRIEKTIKYIETRFLYHIGNEKGDIFFEDYDIQELYEILKGSDDNE